MLFYVELNPIRAKMATTPETSEFTSIKQRIEDRPGNLAVDPGQLEATDSRQIYLKAFIADNEILTDQIPYRLNEYLYLVDWSGRAVRQDKRGAIDLQLPPILARLGIDAEYWCEAMQPKGSHHLSRAVGCPNHLKAYAKKLEIGWIRGIGLCTKLFPA